MNIALNDDDALKRIILGGLRRNPDDLAAQIARLLENPKTEGEDQ